MNGVIIASVISLSAIGIFSAIILFFVAKKFQVEENPKIDEVNEALPGANCGGCGYAGCRNFAEGIVKKGSLDGFFCPVGGNDCMKKVASVMGLVAEEKEAMIAVVRCNGSKQNAPLKVDYDGAKTCAVSHVLFSGESGCPYGCLGFGDCVAACPFDAIHINPETEIPYVDEEKCTACNNCVVACPRKIIQLRPKGKESKRIFVCCVNHEKGGVAKKNCNVACISCSKCAKECPVGAITNADNLAYIDFNKCTLCGKCVVVCPTGAIHANNMLIERMEVKKVEPKKETPVEVKKEEKTIETEKETIKDNKEV